MKQGFTLFMALLAVNVVLVVGLSVYGIIIREIELSGLGRDSQMAFYAADTGIECALFWAIKKDAISTTTPSTIECLEQTITAGGSPISFFDLNFSNGACARVIIDKSSRLSTKIESRGYNLACDSTLSRKVERAIEVIY